MKLISFNVQNFRGLKGNDNKISFENSNLIFLIGNNNSGKSTFLKAYEFFVNPKSIAFNDDFLDKDTSIPIELIAEFRIEPGDEQRHPEWMINKYADKDGIIKIKKLWRSPGAIVEKFSYDPIKQAFFSGGFGGLDTLITKYSPTPIFVNAIATPEDLEKSINDIIAKNHVKKLKSQYATEYDSIIDLLSDLKEKISQAQEIIDINTRVNEQFKNVFPELTINIYSKPGEGIDISKTLKSTHGFQISDSVNSIDLSNNGHGIIRQALFSFLSTNDINIEDDEYIILYEEPELYLHPEVINTLKNELYNLARKKGYQVLCATHSPSMINLAEEHSSLVRLVKDCSTRNTKTYQVEFNIYEGEERNELLMNNRFNPYLCEVFYADEVIIVEGDTEAIIYRELITKHYPNSRNIYILNAGSKSNMVFYQKILTHFGIKHILIHDCDSKFCETKDGTKKINAMWSFNDTIWQQILLSNSIHPNIARRFVQFLNFEKAHGYEYNTSKGKPYSAYIYAKNLEYNSSIPCFVFLDDLFKQSSINTSQTELESIYSTTFSC